MRRAMILAVALSSGLLGYTQQQYFNQFGNLDLERTYADPTIVSIGPFMTIPGQHPKIELRIQHRRTIYTCSVINEAKYRHQNWYIGQKAQVRIAGHFLLMRRSEKSKWIKLNLLGTDEVASL